VGSSPAASTKKTVFDGLFILSKLARTRTRLARLALFLLILLLIFVRTTLERELGSHIPPEDLKARFQGAGGGYIRRRRKSRHKLTFAHSSKD